MKNTILKTPFLWIAAVLLMGAAGYWAVSSGRIDVSSLSLGQTQPEEFVAQVNGEGIQTTLFNARLQQTKDAYTAQGVDFEKSENSDLIREQVLQNMINEVLLIQYGKEQGFEAADENIEAQYQLIVSQFPSEEEFQKNLTAQNATPEQVRESLAQDLIIQQIVNQQTEQSDIEISSDAIQQAYDEAAQAGTEARSFEEAQADIENFLKINQLMSALMEQLRNQAAIEIL